MILAARTPCGWPANTNIDAAERLLFRIVHIFRQQNGSGTGSEHREFMDPAAQYVEAVFAQEMQRRRGLSPEDDETVDVGQRVERPPEDGGRAEGIESIGVRLKIPPDGQDADARCA